MEWLHKKLGATRRSGQNVPRWERLLGSSLLYIRPTSPWCSTPKKSAFSRVMIFGFPWNYYSSLEFPPSVHLKGTCIEPPFFICLHFGVTEAALFQPKMLFFVHKHVRFRDWESKGWSRWVPLFALFITVQWVFFILRVFSSPVTLSYADGCNTSVSCLRVSQASVADSVERVSGLWRFIR